MISRLLRMGDQSLCTLEATLGNASLVMKFLRGLMEFQIRSDDLFVVSYPRSGTTWMQMILYQLTTPGDMSFEHLSDVSPWFERSLAIGSMSAGDFESFASPRIFKSHLPSGWIPKGARYIYMIRDGMDVLVSYYHFYRTHLGYRGTVDEFVDRFERGELQYRSWFKHVAGWRRRKNDFNTLIVNYEDLVSSLEPSIRKIAAFCNLGLPPKKLDRVMERCSFAYMKKHEQKFDHINGLIREKGWQLNTFIRKGGLGGGKTLLKASQIEALDRLSKKTIRHPTLEWRLSEFLH